MSGVKGAGGPVPKRSDQRRRVNKPAVPIDKAEGAASVKPPASAKDWHPVARRWFEALKLSGQARFYEPSDWATAYVIAESMSRELKPQPIVVGSGADAQIEMVSLPPKGASLQAWLKAMGSLMAMEGDRRRLRLELARPQPAASEGAADVSELDEYRARLHRSG